MKYCVIVPTYNNDKTLEKVLVEILKITNDVIVVNDGSTDLTLEILNKFSTVQIITYDNNKGKGYALRKGFEFAISKGYRYAITLDSDGQHFPDDINTFLNKINEYPDSFIIGTRILPEEKMRKGSSFANKFSNFWVRFITGLNLSDTQTGFRLYPLNHIKGMRFFSKKYEFELEILVRLAWKDVKVHEIPIKVFYPSKEERISHFRPFKDFFRISIVNTIFVFLLLLYVKPVSFFRYLKKENIKDFVNRHVIHSDDSASKLAVSVAVGIFMGIVPIWGFQLASAIALAFILKLNKFIVIVAANISIPPMIPFILYLSYVTGGIIFPDASKISFNHQITFNTFKDSLLQYIVGSILFAIVMAFLTGFITFFTVKSVRRNK